MLSLAIPAEEGTMRCRHLVSYTLPFLQGGSILQINYLLENGAHI